MNEDKIQQEEKSSSNGAKVVDGGVVIFEGLNLNGTQESTQLPFDARVPEIPSQPIPTKKHRPGLTEFFQGYQAALEYNLGSITLDHTNKRRPSNSLPQVPKPIKAPSLPHKPKSAGVPYAISNLEEKVLGIPGSNNINSADNDGIKIIEKRGKYDFSILGMAAILPIIAYILNDTYNIKTMVK